MAEKWRERWRKWFRRDNLIILVLSGVLLFIIALPTTGRRERSAVTGIEPASGTDEADGALGDENISGAEDYAGQQERKLAAILSSVEGVGKVEVMLTLRGSGELVVEKDRTARRSNTEERDSAGGSRVTAQVETGGTTIYNTAGGSSTPCVVTTLCPRVEGVLVVAEGAGTGEVNRAITQIVQALYGVEAHRVRVVPMG